LKIFSHQHPFYSNKGIPQGDHLNKGSFWPDFIFELFYILIRLFSGKFIM
jgi:hypothetical protein